MKDGGPAFPKLAAQLPNDHIDWGSDGMSLRDYFAAHAPEMPTGWVGTAPTYERLSRPDGQLVALMEWHWYYADAMLVAREKEQS